MPYAPQDDVLKKLRATFDQWNNPPSPELPEGAGVLSQAAQEIERLRAALQTFVDADPYTMIGAWRDTAVAALKQEK